MVKFFESSKIFFKSTIHRSFGKIYREYDEKCFNVASLINFIVFIDATLKSSIEKTETTTPCPHEIFYKVYFDVFPWHKGYLYIDWIDMMYYNMYLQYQSTTKKSARHHIVTKTFLVWRAHRKLLRISFPHMKVKSLVTSNMKSFKMNLKFKMNTGKTTFFRNQSKIFNLSIKNIRPKLILLLQS